MCARTADIPRSEGDREPYKATYRDAYANGYQHGFYGNETAVNATCVAGIY